MTFLNGIVEFTFSFSKGLHHRLGILDFGRGLCGQGEAELVEQQLMHLPGLGVALHPQFSPVGGGDGHIEHLDLAQPRKHAAGTQAGGRLFVVFLKGDVQAVGEEADENVGFDASIALMKDRAQAEVAFKGAEAFFNAHEVDVVAPEFGGIFSC